MTASILTLSAVLEFSVYAQHTSSLSKPDKLPQIYNYNLRIMKTSFIAPAVLAGLMSVALTFARPVQGNFDLEARNVVDSAYDALYIRDLEAEIFELEARNPMKLPGIVNKLPVPKLPKTETQIKPRPAQTQTQKQQPQQRLPASLQNPKTQTQPKPKTQTQTQQQRQGSPQNSRSKPAGSPTKPPLNTQPNGVPGNTNTNARTGTGQHRHRIHSRPEEITIDVDNNGPLPGGDEKITVDF
ncbi:hypothetical protein H0H93_010629 [Arthromyces matolae]|nr:hypothetical protein H0H93_010629 [Arthromyces matolae]